MDFLNKLGDIANSQFSRIFGSNTNTYPGPQAPSFSAQSVFNPAPKPVPQAKSMAFPMGAGLTPAQNTRAQQVTGLTPPPDPLTVRIAQPLNGGDLFNAFNNNPTRNIGMSPPPQMLPSPQSMPFKMQPTAPAPQPSPQPQSTEFRAPVAQASSFAAPSIPQIPSMGQVSGSGFGGSANILGALSAALGGGNNGTPMTAEEMAKRKKKKTALEMIKGHETRNIPLEEAYKTIGVTGDLGAYQINPQTLQSYGDDATGKPSLTPSQFLADPAAQEQFAQWFWNHLTVDLGMPEDQAIRAWNVGINGSNNPAKKKTADEYYAKVTQ